MESECLSYWDPCQTLAPLHYTNSEYFTFLLINGNSLANDVVYKSGGTGNWSHSAH